VVPTCLTVPRSANDRIVGDVTGDACVVEQQNEAEQTGPVSEQLAVGVVEVGVARTGEQDRVRAVAVGDAQRAPAPKSPAAAPARCESWSGGYSLEPR
jgi:hypothetical protein